MSDDKTKVENFTEEDRRRIAAIHLMRYFNYCIVEHAEGRVPGDPDAMGPAVSKDELDDALERCSIVLTGDAGEWAEQHTLLAFEAFADMIGHAGAELENLMQVIITGEERPMMVVRLRKAT